MKAKFTLTVLLAFGAVAANVYAAPKEGDLIQSSGAVYVVRDGKRCAIPSMQVLKANGFKTESIVKISDEDMNALPTGVDLAAPIKPYKTAKEGDLIQASGAVFVIRDGKRCGIPSEEVFTANKFNAADVIRISDDDEQAIPEGPIVE